MNDLLREVACVNVVLYQNAVSLRLNFTCFTQTPQQMPADVHKNPLLSVSVCTVIPCWAWSETLALTEHYITSNNTSSLPVNTSQLKIFCFL